MNLPSTELKTIQDKIQESIRSTFLDMLPPETFQKMVEAEIKEFTTSPQSWNSPKRSPLQNLIIKEVEAMISKSIADELSKPEYQEHWQDGKTIASKFIKDVVKENINDIVAATFGSMTQHTMQMVRNHLQTFRPS